MPTLEASSQLAHHEDPFARVERLARFLDDAIPVPFTRFRIGLDSVIGLVPVVGDFAGMAIGSYLVWEAHQLGAPGALKLKMMRNVVIDGLAGLVPVIGDVVDMVYKSNRRNMTLLRGHYRPLSPVTRRRDHWIKWVLRLTLAAAAASGVWWWRQH